MDRIERRNKFISDSYPRFLKEMHKLGISKEELIFIRSKIHNYMELVEWAHFYEYLWLIEEELGDRNE